MKKKKKGNGFKGLVLEDKRQCKIDFTFANTKGRFPVQEFSEKISFVELSQILPKYLLLIK